MPRDGCRGNDSEIIGISCYHEQIYLRKQEIVPSNILPHILIKFASIVIIILMFTIFLSVYAIDSMMYR